MAKAFECDLCKELVKNANGGDTFHPKRVKIRITYSHPVNGKPYDLCLECRMDLLKHIIQGIEAKQKYTWEDLNDASKLAELL